MLALMMDVMLPVTEWLARSVDRLLEVSDDIVDRGRGMNSTVSEKPTLGRDDPSAEEERRPPADAGDSWIALVVTG